MRRRMARWTVQGAAVALSGLAWSSGAGCGQASFGDCSDNGTCSDGSAADAQVATDVSVLDGPSVDGPALDSGEGAPSDATYDSDGPGDAPADSDGEADQDADQNTIPLCSATVPHDPCLVDTATGIFVSPTGSDAEGLGTAASPFATLGRGLDAAQAAHARLFVCAGTYAEKVVVNAARDGMHIAGGIDCATSTYSASNKVLVKPTLPGYALEVDSVPTGALFDDLAFYAPDADPTHAGESSIAAFVHGSQGVSFRRVTFVAGKGAAGAAGPSFGPATDAGAAGIASNWAGTPPTYAELNGVNAASAGGTLAQGCTCRDSTQSNSTQSIGGNGGGTGLKPGDGQPTSATAGAGAGGTNGSDCASGGGGAKGANAPQSVAATANSSPGVLSPAGFSSGSGAPGPDGQPGQGGGGGGSGLGSAGGGGSGACGGCGGSGALGGSGGGASIGLAVFGSAASLTGCVLEAHVAGAGGPGGSGESGQTGGSGGIGFGFGCQGGHGGYGSGGNGGQGGAGGVSVGIAYSGMPPTFDGAALTDASPTLLDVVVPAIAAPGGAGGAGGSGNGAPAGLAGAKGPDGVSQAGLAL